MEEPAVRGRVQLVEVAYQCRIPTLSLSQYSLVSSQDAVCSSNDYWAQYSVIHCVTVMAVPPGTSDTRSCGTERHA